MPKAFNTEEKEIIKNDLLTKSLELFSKKGLRKTSLDEICRSVGIAKGSFYRFFSSKENLVFKLLELAEERIHQNILKDVCAALSLQEALEIILKTSLATNEDPLLQILHDPIELTWLLRAVPPQERENLLNVDFILSRQIYQILKQKNWELKISPEEFTALGRILVNLYWNSFPSEQSLKTETTKMQNLILDSLIYRLSQGASCE